MQQPNENNPHRAQTNGVRFTVPCYFARLLWQYVDSLPVQGIQLSSALHFHIRQNAGDCRVACVQTGPEYRHQWEIQLFNKTDILPDEIVVGTFGDRQIMCLPEELPDLQQRYGQVT
ncbi:MAG: DUF960 family protein [Schleiferilactobacillus perolens]|uniref:DUF960 family protein n=1 Tax=Schleiferilactobacillus perolens TaxID=100468 RepID=UPI0039E9C20A